MRLRDYAILHNVGKLTFDQAAEEYRKAMENFDQLMELADKEPGRLVACKAEMARGFILPQD
jgi:hypothetical protein